MEKKPMLTLSQVMGKLAKDKGIHREFRMNENGEMKLQDNETVYTPQDLKIVKSYRFEGESNPSDNSVLYVVQDQTGNKGIVIDSYGAESNHHESFDEFLRDIPVEEQDEYSFE